ncbi:MAG: hypothetical protein ACRENP_25760, partial [Longimicrobiales bacterium]
TMNDNAHMITFDDIEIRRPELAKSYLQLLQAQPGRPIALFAPRRVGKTFFLDQDLTPVSRKARFVPVYADLWLNQAAPLAAINHALEEALDDLTVPATRAGKIGKTPVKKIGMLSASVELGDEPTRRKLPDDPALRFDTLVARLASQSGHTILLMLDEVQVLAELADGRSAIATIRAVLQKRKRDVLAVFTGSSQEALAAMTVASGGPMYQFAQLLDFPTLGIEYPKALAKHFASVHADKTLDVDDLVKAFEFLGHKPALMKDLVKWMSAEGVTDVQLALNRFVQDGRLIAGWEGLLASLQPFEQVLLSVIAKGHAPFAKGTITLLNKDPRFTASVSKVRAALERLRKSGVLAKTAGRGYLIDDTLFAEFLKRH